jgi:hypothetical protein
MKLIKIKRSFFPKACAAFLPLWAAAVLMLACVGPAEYSPKLPIVIVETAVVITGDYRAVAGTGAMSGTDESVELQVFFTDGDDAEGYLDGETGVVMLYDGEWNDDVAGEKIIHTLRLLQPGTDILVGRKFDTPGLVELSVDGSGKLQFRDPLANNPNDMGVSYIPIGTVGELALIGWSRAALAGRYVLDGDLDLLGAPPAGNDGFAVAAHNWEPISGADPINEDDDRFSGIFDGAGNKIVNLNINRPDKDFAGLFSFVGATGKIRNVHILTGVVAGRDYTGGVAGWNKGSISACYNAGAIVGGEYVGGVAGYNDNQGGISACYNTGTVAGRDFVGGVAGVNLNNGTITACYNEKVISGGECVGGVAGVNYGIMTACYNTDAVSGIKYIGGVVGKNTQTISACYNTATVSGGECIGGVAGANSGTSTGCYWLNLSSQTGLNSASLADGDGVIPDDSTSFLAFAEEEEQWPSDNPAAGWGVAGTGEDGNYWRDLGAWDAGDYGRNSTFPRLYWETVDQAGAERL